MVVLASGSSSLFTWELSVEGLPLKAERLLHTCTKWQSRALSILLSGTAHLVSGGSYPQILQIWPILSAEQNNGNFLRVSDWKLWRSSSLAWQPGGKLRWWIFVLSEPGCDSSSFVFRLWEIWLWPREELNWWPNREQCFSEGPSSRVVSAWRIVNATL